MSVASITLIAAVAFTVVGVGTFIHFYVMVLRWPRATGEVTGNVTQARSFGANEHAHFPRIKFQAADGQHYEIQGDIGLNEEWPLGLKVDLRYRAADPSQATIMKSWQRLAFASVFIAFALLAWYAWLAVPLN